MAAIATGILAMRRARWMDGHTCSYYCRGGCHADVIFCRPDDPDIARSLRVPLAALGWRLLHHEPAAETTDQPDATQCIDDLGRIVRCDDAGGPFVPYLVVWGE